MSISSMGPAQLGFDLGNEEASKPYAPDPGEIRVELSAMLAAVRNIMAEADLDRRAFRYNKVVFPQMAKWLPDDEANQLCFEFAREVERVERLLAA